MAQRVCGNNDLASQIAANLRQPDSFERAVGTVGDIMKRREDKFLKVVSNENASEGDIQKAKMAFERASRAFEALGKMYENVDERIRRALQSLANR